MSNTCPRCKSLNTTYIDDDDNLACLYCGYRPTREIRPVDLITDKVYLPSEHAPRRRF